MISLRELQEKDAPLMLEWMHDLNIQRGFQKKFTTATLDQVNEFISNAVINEMPSQGESLHYAIVDEQDEYLGTISLKDIDWKNQSAEYAIATRKSAQGRGIAFAATGLLLKKAFRELNLHRVYLNVLADNAAAIRLYERSGFVFEGEFRDHLKREDHFVNWRWYGILQSEFNEEIFADSKKI